MGHLGLSGGPGLLQLFPDCVSHVLLGRRDLGHDSRKVSVPDRDLENDTQALWILSLDLAKCGHSHRWFFQLRRGSHADWPAVQMAKSRRPAR